jgi:hypothetical protein|tara:strand:- start:97 stop:543 length:447 start_codon:yes stop_codon:yes gene_type:complete
MIESIFEDLNPYLRGIKKADNYSIVEVHLKQSWLIPQHGSIEDQKKPITKEPGKLYHMFYSESDSFDTIISWVKESVIDMNIEVELKEELLRQKVTQLKEVFETSSLDELKSMKFSSDTDVLKLNGSSDTKKDEKPEVINLKEVKEKV